MSVADRRRRQNRRRSAQRTRAQERDIQNSGQADRESVFAPPTTTEACTSCQERAREGRDPIRNMHRPRRMTFPLTEGGEVCCEECGGLGYRPTAPRPDPYDLNGKESRDSAERLRLWQLRTPPTSR